MSIGVSEASLSDIAAVANRNDGYGNDGMHSYSSRDGAKERMMEQLEDMLEQSETPKQKEAILHCMTALKKA